jgi:hypothetical protein
MLAVAGSAISTRLRAAILRSLAYMPCTVVAIARTRMPSGSIRTDGMDSVGEWRRWCGWNESLRGTGYRLQATAQIASLDTHATLRLSDV